MRKTSGVNTLRKHYGTKQRNGTCTEHCRKSAGKVIRHCLEQLEKQSLVGPVEYKNENGSTLVNGKALTKKGITDMDRIAAALAKDKRN
jgi:ribosomal protein S19E (S16A)